jgi:hypothetical protein
MNASGFVCGYEAGADLYDRATTLGRTFGDVDVNDAVRDGYARRCRSLTFGPGGPASAPGAPAFGPGATARKRVPGTVPAGTVVFEGVPVGHEMDSFVQPFRQCETPRDVWNRTVKNRMHEFGKPNNGARIMPALKPCMPEMQHVTRQCGAPVSIDGAPDFTPGFRSTDAESALFGVGNPQQGADAVRRAFTQDVSVCSPAYEYARLQGGRGIAGAFSQSAVTAANIDHQLDNIHARGHGGLFRNNSRAKLARR